MDEETKALLASLNSRLDTIENTRTDPTPDPTPDPEPEPISDPEPEGMTDIERIMAKMDKQEEELVALRSSAFSKDEVLKTIEEKNKLNELVGRVPESHKLILKAIEGQSVEDQIKFITDNNLSSSSNGSYNGGSSSGLDGAALSEAGRLMKLASEHPLTKELNINKKDMEIVSDMDGDPAAIPTEYVDYERKLLRICSRAGGNYAKLVAGVSELSKQQAK